MIDNIWFSREDLIERAAILVRDIFKNKINAYGYGVPELDRINPIFPKSIHFIGGKTGSGKTRFINYALDHMALQKKMIAYVTIEDAPENVGLKLIEKKSGTSLLHILEWLTFKNKAKIFNNILDIFKRTNSEIDNKYVQSAFFNSLELEQFIELIRKYSTLFKVWVIDYVQALKTTGSTYDKNCLIAEALRAVAIECNISIIGIAQLNRQTDNILTDSPPSMNHIQGSGFYEQVASSVLLLHRVQEKKKNYFLPTKEVDAYLFKNRVSGIVKKFRLDENYKEIEDLDNNTGSFK